MIAVIQRCTHARVMIGNRTLGKIQNGLVILLGVKKNDTDNDAEFLAHKISNLRIFNDQNDRMNLSIQDVKGSSASFVYAESPRVNPLLLNDLILFEAVASASSRSEDRCLVTPLFESVIL